MSIASRKAQRARRLIAPRRTSRPWLEPLEDRRVLSAGTLDPSFGAGGIVTTEFLGNYLLDTALAIDHENRILQLGYYSDDGQTGIAVARFEADGTLDTTFGNSGFQTLDSAGFGNFGSASIAVQPDGSVVTAYAVSPPSGPNFNVVTRLTPGGQIDTSFGDGGMVALDNAWYSVCDVAVRTDGSILVAGTGWGSDDETGFHNELDFLIMKLSPGGSFLGLANFDFTPNRTGPQDTYDFASDLVVEPDGSVVVVGDTGTGTTGYRDFAVLRLTPSLVPDPTFGVNGRTVIDANHSLGWGGDAPSVAVQPDRSIVLAGSTLGNDITVYRLTPDGGLDVSFGNGGKQTIAFPLYGGASGVNVLPDGSIVVAASQNDFMLARLTAGGQLDPSFGSGGLVTTDVGSGFSRSDSVVMLADGNLVVAGVSTDAATNDGPWGFALARYQGYDSAVVGTQGDDIITIEPGTQAGTLRATVNGVVTDNIPGGQMVLIDGLSGNDSLTVASSVAGALILAGRDGSDTYDISFGNLAGTVVVAESGTAGSDQLIARGTSAGDYLFKDSKRVTFGNPTLETIRYTGIESRTIHGGGGNDTIVDPGSDTWLLGDEGDDTIIVNATSGTGVVVDGGEGSDSYVIGGGSLLGPVVVLDSGASGIDAVTIVGLPGDVLVPAEFGFTLNGTAIELSAELETIDTIGFNSAPTIAEMGSQGYTDTEVTVPVVATDPDEGDTLTYSVTFVSRIGAGAVNDPTGFSIDSDGLFRWTPGGGQLGEYTFQARVEDGAGAFVEQTFDVTTLGMVDGVLTIVGTDGADRIVVKASDSDSDELKVRINERDYGFLLRPRDNPADPYSGVSRILVRGLAGDDELVVKPEVGVSSWLFGGDGDDKLKGGSGDDVLIGGAGDDLIVAGTGRDLLIGGMEADRLVGDAGDDLVIAGWTAFDAVDSALAAIMAEWTSTRSYAARVRNLRGDSTSSTFAARLNGNIFLAVDSSHGRPVTVFDDGVKDVLTGEGGTDWFLFNADGDHEARKDKITDLLAAEFADDLDFIEG